MPNFLTKMRDSTLIPTTTMTSTRTTRKAVLPHAP